MARVRGRFFGFVALNHGCVREMRRFVQHLFTSYILESFCLVTATPAVFLGLPVYDLSSPYFRSRSSFVSRSVLAVSPPFRPLGPSLKHNTRAYLDRACLSVPIYAVVCSLCCSRAVSIQARPVEQAPPVGVPVPPEARLVPLDSGARAPAVQRLVSSAVAQARRQRQRGG